MNYEFMYYFMYYGLEVGYAVLFVEMFAQISAKGQLADPNFLLYVVRTTASYCRARPI